MSTEDAPQEFEEMAAAMAGARRSAGNVVEPSHTDSMATEDTIVDSGPVRVQIGIIIALVFIIWIVLQKQYY